MPPTPDVPALVAVLKGMLHKPAPERDFVIVDRYLFPKQRPDDYLDTLFETIEPVVRRTRQLLVVTSPRYDDLLLHELRQQLHALYPDCRFAHRSSESFHDRFWIADKERGLFLGTSLNGLGRRYALVDYMASSDVQEIIAALRAEGLMQ